MKVTRAMIRKFTNEGYASTENSSSGTGSGRVSPGFVRTWGSSRSSWEAAANMVEKPVKTRVSVTLTRPYVNALDRRARTLICLAIAGAMLWVGRRRS
jgi:hypothetical protein